MTTPIQSKQPDLPAFESRREIPSFITPEWDKELLHTLTWIQENWKILGISILILTTLAMYRYLQNEGIPLSITSTEVTKGLPTVFIVLTFTLGLLTWTLASPANILSTPFPADGEGQNATCLMEKIGAHPIRTGTAWITGMGLIAVSTDWLLCRHYPGLYLFGLIVFGAIALGELMALLSLVERKKRRTIALHIARKLCFGSFLQTLIIIFLIASVEHSFKHNSDSFSSRLAVTVTTAILAAVQFFLVGLYHRAQKNPGSLRFILFAVGCLMFLVCIEPSLNHFFLNTVLASSASGGRSCAQLTLADTTRVAPEILSPANPQEKSRHTSGLQIVMATDNNYYAHLWPQPGQQTIFGTYMSARTRPIFVIPAASVTAISTCSEK